MHFALSSLAYKLLSHNKLCIDRGFTLHIVASAMDTQFLPGVDWRDTQESIRWTTFANIWDFSLKCFVDYNDQGELIDRALLQASNDNNKNSIQQLHAQQERETQHGGSDIRAAKGNGYAQAYI